MRFSLTIALAATLAIIAGSVIATPGPLYARALEQVNPFERDEVDIYSRNHQKSHQVVAEKLAPAIDATKLAIDLTQNAITQAHPLWQPRWTGENAHHRAMLPLLQKMQQEHSDAAMQPYKTHLFNNVDATLEHVGEVAADALKSSKQAKQAMTDYKKACAALSSAKRSTQWAIGKTQDKINLEHSYTKQIWMDRLAELQQMDSQREAMYQAYNYPKEPPMDSSHSRVSAQAADIKDRARSLGGKAKNAIRSVRNQNLKKGRM